MIHFLTLPNKSGPMSRYFKTWGRPLARRVRFLTYDAVSDPSALPDSTYVFADVDRLSERETERAQAIWNGLARRGSGVRLYNNPERCVRRYDLLRRLHEDGRNGFNVFRLREVGPTARFPVFIRHAERHTGALTGLLPDMKGLQRAADRLVARGHDPASLIAVEFLDTSSEGVFRKFSAMQVGERVIAHHVLSSTDWHVKAATFIPWSPAMVEEESRFQQQNPHRAHIRAAFQLAGIQFGRMDYGVCNGKVQVWEINTNPLLLPPPEIYAPYQMPNKLRFAASLNAALDAIDHRPGFWPPFARLFARAFGIPASPDTPAGWG